MFLLFLQQLLLLLLLLLLLCCLLIILLLQLCTDPPTYADPQERNPHCLQLLVPLDKQ